jgi:hypothetical protein
MPSVSKKQHNFMAAIAKNPAFAKKVGMKPSVGEHFLNADKGKKFGSGGMKKVRKYAEGDMVEDTEDGGAYVGSRLNMGKDRGSRLGRVSKEDSDMIKKQDEASGMNKNPRMGGLARAGISAGLGDKRAAYGGFKKGGMADAKEDMKMDKSQDKAMIKKAFKQHDAQEHKGGKGTKLTLKKGGMACAPKKMAKGDSFRSSADGCATKGKTKGTMISMKKGGVC